MYKQSQREEEMKQEKEKQLRFEKKKQFLVALKE